MRAGRTVAVLIWLATLGGLIIQFNAPLELRDLKLFEALLPKIFTVLAIVSLPVSAFWVEYSFDVPRLRTWIDKKWGEGTYVGFMCDLKPMLQMGVAALVGAVSCWLKIYALAAPAHAHWACGLSFGCGVGFLLHRVVLARRGLLMESRSPSASWGYR